MKRQRGYVLLLSLAILAGIMTLGVSMMKNAASGRKIASVSGKGSQSRYAAESAISLLINRAANSVDSNGYLVEFPSTNLSIHNHTVRVGMEVEDDEDGSLRVDSIRGKYDLLTFRSYANIEAMSTDNAAGSTARIRQRIAFDQYPLFQFAIYWEGVMLLDPGSNMTINGRVHCNSRVKIFPYGNLSLDDWFTSACTILHQGPGGSSRIRLKRVESGMGAYRTPPASFTAVDTPYYSSSPSKRMRMAYGSQVPYFKMPVGARNPIIIIQPKNVNDRGQFGFTETETTKRQKLVYKADLIYRKRSPSFVVVRDWARNQATGTDLSVATSLKTSLNLAMVPPTSLPSGFHPDSLYDYGDREWMNAVYVNVANLLSASSADDKIIYLEGNWNTAASPRRRDVFILYNGSTLSRPVTFASNCPVYIWGHYNSVSTKSAAVIADIITILSPNWRGSYGPSTSSRTGADMTVKACLMGGVRRARINTAWNNPDDANYYNWNQADNASYSDRIGQPHNHTNFMEDWSGATFTYSGSLVAAWRCLYLTGNYRWNPGNDVYVQPERNYSFDPMYNQLRNMPPGTPTVISPFNLDYYEIHEE